MKVRWTGDSLRLRITPTELAALERGDAVAERLGAWGVVLDPAAAGAGVDWDGATARVGLAPGDVRRLAAPDAEGVYPPVAGLRLLVEKDFPCAHPHPPEAQEPETERFAPTAGFSARKETG